MKTTRKRFPLLLILAAFLLAAGCTTTRTEHGVQIEEKRSFNPLDYLPW